jgi:hypothetical protein
MQGQIAGLRGEVCDCLKEFDNPYKFMAIIKGRRTSLKL